MTFRKSSFCSGGSCVEVAFERSTFCASGNCVEVGFERSSFCTHGNCVEVGHADDGMVLLRDGKNPDGPVLKFSPEAWDAFLEFVPTV
jgi:hypothetical protein